MLTPTITEKHMAYKCLMIIMLGIITLGLTLGCEDSPESAARKQVNQSIEQTSLLIQEGQPTSTGESGGLQTDQESFNNTISAWDQMFNNISPNDADTLKAAAWRINAMGSELIEQGEVTTSQSDSIQKIQQLLTQASAAARQSGARDAQTGPDLLMATIHLINARDKINQLTQHAAQTHTKQAVISDLLSSLFKERKISIDVENRRPTERINLLKERLENPKTGLNQELVKTEAIVNQLLTDRVVWQKQYQTAREASVAIQRQYNELLIQADNVEGALRFQLQQQAYKLQVGYEQNGDKVKGSIELETQAQRLENQLNALESKLQYQLLWQGKVRQDIRSLQDTIDQLQSAELSQSITSNYDKSIQRQKNLIGLISQQLNELQTAEEQYAALRQEAAETFDSARNTFDDASMAAMTGNNRDISNYAKALKLIATKELAQLWLNDASHNQLGKTILLSAVKVPEITNLAEQMQHACEQAQAQAILKDQELQVEIAAAEAEAPPAREYAAVEPAGGYPAETIRDIQENIPEQPPTITPPSTFTDPNSTGGDRTNRGNRGDRSNRGNRGNRGNRTSDPNRIR